VLLVALSVGLDNFAAAIAIGLGGVGARVRVRVAAVFGLFEGGMPVVGLLLGRGLATTLGGRAHLVGGLLLVATGGYGLLATWRDRRHGAGTAGAKPLALGQLVLTGLALSVDNLIVGFALGTYRVPVALAAVLIAAISVALSLVGLELGHRLGAVVRELGELVGGVVLVLVGVLIATGALG